MTRAEFSNLMKQIGLGIGKHVDPESLPIYFRCLQELTVDDMADAVRKVLVNHPWPTFPSVGEIYKVLIEAADGETEADRRLHAIMRENGKRERELQRQADEQLKIIRGETK